MRERVKAIALRVWTIGWRVVVFALLASVLSVEGARAARGYWGQEAREWFAVKSIDSRMPVDVLDVIHEQSDFSVAQVLALIMVESKGNPRAVSEDGNHVGLMMVKLSWAKVYGVSEEDLFDPEINVRIGLDLLRQEKERYGNEYHYISGYNCKKSTMAKFLKDGTRLPKETRTHWKRYQIYKQKYEDWLERGEWHE